MTFNPTLKADCDRLIETLEVDFEDASVIHFTEAPRKHLGASIIGKKCAKQIWYNFRHAIAGDFSSKNRTHGQMLRLFNRGHREEDAIRPILERVGFRFIPPPEGEHQQPRTKADMGPLRRLARRHSLFA